MFTPCVLACGTCLCADELRASPAPGPAAAAADTGRRTPSPAAVALLSSPRVTVTVSARSWRQAMDRLTETMAATLTDLAPRLQAIGAALQQLDRATTQPRPLPIDGHAYHRRTRARSRRTR